VEAIERVTGIRPNPENLVFLTADLTPDGLPDLGTIDGQKRLEKYLEGFDLIIVDNLSTLCRTGAENEADSWGIMQAWAVNQRSLGRSVLLVHHAGKSGAQRGTSRREDVLGTVIQLKHPSGYTPTEGANFEIHFTKARGFFGLDAEPLEAQLNLDGIWTWKRLNEAKAADAVALYQEGKTMREVAKELGISSSTVSGYITAAGIPTKRGRPPKKEPGN
jgi:putative DNA primase/helicase